MYKGGKGERGDREWEKGGGGLCSLRLTFCCRVLWQRGGELEGDGREGGQCRVMSSELQVIRYRRKGQACTGSFGSANVTVGLAIRGRGRSHN